MSLTRALADELARIHRPTGKPPLALVVDDSASDVDLTCRALESAGCNTAVARTGQEAITCIAFSLDPIAESIDIVFLDLNLPGMSGVDVLKWIRANVPMMIVVIITHRSFMMLIDEATKLGFLELLEKPLTVDCITEVLTKHRIEVRQ